jgi:hypothetical protein
MFNPTQILLNTFLVDLKAKYQQMFCRATYTETISWVARVALETIANSDALYHDVEHTILVTLVGQEILSGKMMQAGGVSERDWLHFMVSLLCHDIGYVRGACLKDERNHRLFVTGKTTERVYLAPGATDASLMPYHVDRGKLFVQERFGSNPDLDIPLIQANIEFTRFPIPLEYQDTLHYHGLARAADLIGQLSDPRYLQKVTGLFYEFEETGMNKVLGYRHPEDLRQNYPQFYWTIYPYITPALDYLKHTQVGKQILAQLYAHVFEMEHRLSWSLSDSLLAPEPATLLTEDTPGGVPELKSDDEDTNTLRIAS